MNIKSFVFCKLALTFSWNLVFGAPVDSALEAQIKDRFIVTLKPESLVTVHKQDFLQDFLRKYPTVQLVQTFEIGAEFQGYALDLPNGEHIDELRANSDIKQIEHDQICQIALTQQGAAWHLARISKRDLPLQTTYTYTAYAGAGVDIYILDTGVRTTHVEFSGRASFGASFNGEPGEGDDNGHGTNVAGIAAGTIYGVAKKANIIAVRVLQANGYGAWSNVIAGIQWVYNSYTARNNPSVINLSVSGGYSDALNSAVRGIIKLGVNVVVAAGNNAADACTVSPASEPYAITVGSTSPSDSASSFSNFGPCVDINAPGENVLAAYNPSDYSTAYMSGTSMASPIVAGVKALFLSKNLASATPFTVTTLDQYLIQSAIQNHISGLQTKTPNLLIYDNPPRSLLTSDNDAADDDEQSKPPHGLVQQL